jgi:hypothetical protein
MNKAIDVGDGLIHSVSLPCYPLFEFAHSDPRWDAALARMKVGRCKR